MTTKSEAMETAVLIAEKIGNGVSGLTNNHKIARMEKIIGSEAEKIINLGINKSKGVSFVRGVSGVISPDGYISTNGLDPYIKENKENFPADIRDKTIEKNKRILNVEVNDDGTAMVFGIIFNGNEEDPRIRQTYGFSACSDKDLARIELKAFNEGKSFKVHERTMDIHRESGDLDKFIDSGRITIGEDLEGDY
jgi:hypothetical protein